MSQVDIRAALETALATISPAVATAHENVAFTPPAASVPYQEAFLLPADPDNSEWGSSRRELGLFQVSLRYPLQAGDATARTRAGLIAALFKRGASFTSGTTTITITHSPTIGAGTAVDGRWFVPVRIRYRSGVLS